MKTAWGGNNQEQVYTYDGEGRRVRRKVDGVETWMVYGIGGELLAEYPANGAANAPTKEYGYRNGQLLITAAPPSGSGSTQNVSWTNAVGVSVSGNSLTKTAANAWGNAGAASTQTITSGDGYVEFSASTTGDSIIGLGNGDPDQSYNIGFTIHVDLGNASIWEAGVWKVNVGTYVDSDRFRVAIENGVVKYRKNGSLLYTSTVGPSYPLLVDSALYLNGSTLTNVVISGNLSGGGSGGSTINWLVSDHLGTPRMIFDQTGSLANVKRHDYLPFGEELFGGPVGSPGAGGRTTTQGYTGDSVRQKFTGYEHDPETSLEFAQARYFGSTQGRFISPDPYLGSGRLGNPQSWNRYSYVLNDPINRVDPLGLQDKGKNGANDPQIKEYNLDPSDGIDFSCKGCSIRIVTNWDKTIVAPSSYEEGMNAVSAIRRGLGIPSLADDYGSGTSGDGQDVAVGNALNVAGAIANVEASRTYRPGEFWRGVNGVRYTNMVGPGPNGSTGPRWLAVQNAGACRAFGVGAGVMGMGLSGVSGIEAFQRGDSRGATKAGIDFTFGAISTLGGPKGAAIGAAYFAVDMTVGWPAVIHHGAKRPVLTGVLPPTTGLMF